MWWGQPEDKQVPEKEPAAAELQHHDEREVINRLQDLVRQKDEKLRQVEKDHVGKMAKLKLQHKAKISQLTNQLMEAQQKNSSPQLPDMEPSFGNKKQEEDDDVSSESSSSTTSEQSNRGKVLLLKKKMEENKILFEKREKELQANKQEVEKLVESLKLQILQRDEDILSMQKLSTRISSTGNSIHDAIDLQDMYTQILYKDQKIMELNDCIKQLEGQVMDLQEHVHEKEEVIQSRNKAIQLMTEDLNKRGKTVVDQLDDTRDEMKQMQNLFLQHEADWKIEEERLKIELESTKEIFDGKLSEKDNWIAEMKEKIDKLESVRFDLSARNAALQEKLVLLQGTLQKVKEENKTTLDDSKHECQRVIELNEALKEKDALISSLQTTLDDASSGKTDSNKSIVKVKAQYVSRIKSLEKQLKELKVSPDLTLLQQQVSLLSAENTELHKINNDGLNSRVKELMEKVQMQSEELNNYMQMISLLEKDKLDMAEFNQKLKKELILSREQSTSLSNEKEFAERLLELEELCNGLQMKNKELFDSMNEINNQLQEERQLTIVIKEEKKQLQDAIEELNVEICSQRSSYAEIEKRLVVKENELSQVQNCLEVRELDLSSVTSQQQKVKELLSNFCEKHELSKPTVDEMNDRWQKIQNDQLKLEADVSELLQVFNSKDINELTMKFKELEQHKMSLDVTVNQLQNELLQIKDSAAELEKQIEHVHATSKEEKENLNLQLQQQITVSELLKAEIGAKDMQLSETISELQNLTLKYESLQEELLASKQAIEKVLLDKQEHSTDAEQKLSLVMENDNAKQQQILKLTSEIEVLLKKDEAIAVEKLKADEQLQLLNSRLISYEQEIAELQRLISVKESAVTQAEDSGRNLHNQLQQLQQLLKEKENDLVGIIQERDQSIMELRDQVNGLVKQMNTVESLQMSAMEQEKLVEQLEQELQMKSIKLTEMEDAQIEQRKRSDELKSNYDNMEQQYLKSQESIEAMEKENFLLTDKMHEQEDMIENLNVVISEKDNATSEIKRAVEQLSSEKIAVEEVVKMLENSIRQMTEEHKIYVDTLQTEKENNNKSLQEEINQKLELVEGLREQISSLENEKLCLRSAIESHASESDEVKSSLINDKLQLEDDLRQRSSEIEKLTKLMENADEEKVQLLSEKETIIGRIKELEQLLQQSESEAASTAENTSKNIQQLTLLLEERNTALKILQQQLNEKCEEVNRSGVIFSDFEEGVSKLKQQLSDAEGQLKLLLIENEQCQLQMIKKVDEIESLTKENDQLKIDISAQGEQMVAYEKDVQSSKAQIAEYEKELTNKSDKLLESELAVKNFVDKIEEIEIRVVELQNLTDSQSSEIHDLKDRLMVMGQEKAVLVEQLETEKALTNDAKSQNENVDFHCKDLQNRNELLENSVKTLKQELDLVKVKLQECEDELRESLSKCDNFATELQKQQDKNSALNEFLNKCKENEMALAQHLESEQISLTNAKKHNEDINSLFVQEKEKYENEIIGLKSNIESIQLQMKQANQTYLEKMEASQLKCEQLEMSLEQSSDLCQRFKSDMENLKTECEKAKQDNSYVEHRHKEELYTNKQQAELHYKEMQEQNQQLEVAVVNLKQELTMLTNNLLEYQEQLKQSFVKADMLANELQNKQAENSALNDVLTKFKDQEVTWSQKMERLYYLEDQNQSVKQYLNVLEEDIKQKTKGLDIGEAHRKSVMSEISIILQTCQKLPRLNDMPLELIDKQAGDCDSTCFALKMLNDVILKYQEEIGMLEQKLQLIPKLQQQLQTMEENVLHSRHELQQFKNQLDERTELLSTRDAIISELAKTSDVKEEEIKLLQTERDEIKITLEKFEEQIRTQATDCASHVKETEDKNQIISLLQQEIEQHMNSHSVLKEELSNAIENVNILSAENRLLQQQCQNLENEAALQMANIRSIEEVHQNASRDQQATMNTIFNLNEENRLIRNEHEIELKAKMEQLEHLKMELATTKNYAVHIDRIIQDNAQEKEILECMVSSCKENILQLTEKCASLEMLSQHKEPVDIISEEQQLFESKINDLEVKVTALSSRSSDMNTENEKMHLLIHERETRLKQYEEMQAQQHKELSHLQTRQHELDKEFLKVSLEKQNIVESFKNLLQSVYADVEIDIDDVLCGERNKLDDAVDGLISKFRDLMQSSVDLEIINTALQKNVELLQQEAEELKAQLKSLSDKKQDAKSPEISKSALLDFADSVWTKTEQQKMDEKVLIPSKQNNEESEPIELLSENAQLKEELKELKFKLQSLISQHDAPLIAKATLLGNDNDHTNVESAATISPELELGSEIVNNDPMFSISKTSPSHEQLQKTDPNPTIVDDLKKRIQKFTEEQNVLKIKNGKMLAKLKQFKDKNDKLQEELNQRISQQTSDKLKDTELLKEKEILSFNVVELTETVMKLEAEKSHLDEHNSELLMSVQSFEVEVKNLKDQKNSLEKEMTVMKTNIEELKHKVMDCEVQLQQLQSEKQQLVSSLDATNEQMEQLTSDNSTYQELVETLKASKVKLEEEFRQQVTSAYHVNEEKNALESEVNRLNRQLDKKEQYLAESVNHIQELCAEQLASEENVKILEMELVTLEMSINQLREENSLLQQKISDHIETPCSACQSKQEEIDTLALEKASLEKQISDLNADLLKSSDKILDLTSMSGESERENTQLKVRLGESVTEKLQMTPLLHEERLVTSAAKEETDSSNYTKERWEQLELNLMEMALARDKVLQNQQDIQRHADDERHHYRQQIERLEQSLHVQSVELKLCREQLQLQKHQFNSKVEEEQVQISEVAALNERLRNKELETETLSNRITSLQQELQVASSFQQELEMLSLENRRLQQELEMLSSENKRLQQELEMLSSENKRLQQQLTDIQKVQALQHATSANNSTVVLSENLDVLQIQNELQQTFHALHHRDQRCEQLTEDISRLIDERDALQIRLTSCMKTLHQKDIHLQEMQVELDEKLHFNKPNSHETSIDVEHEHLPLMVPDTSYTLTRTFSSPLWQGLKNWLYGRSFYHKPVQHV